MNQPARLIRAVEKRLLQLRGGMTLRLIAHRLPDWFRADITLTLEGGLLRTQLGEGSAAALGETGG